jgi:hypothetical protein
MRTVPGNIRAYKLSATSIFAVWASSLLVLFCPAPAHALQPLSEFFSASHKASTDARQAALVTVQREADEMIAASQLLPSVAASGSYTLNQFESVISMPQGSVVIQPRHGLSGSAQLSIPLLDLASWRRKKAADRVVEAARLSQETTALEVDRQVAQYYFQLIGAEALRRSYQSSLAVAEESRSVTVAKREEGVATDLEVARATVEVEGIRRSLAEQQLSIALARRALTTLTGIVPSADVPDVADDLHGGSCTRCMGGTHLATADYSRSRRVDRGRSRAGKSCPACAASHRGSDGNRTSDKRGRVGRSRDVLHRDGDGKLAVGSGRTGATKGARRGRASGAGTRGSYCQSRARRCPRSLAARG